MADVYVALTGLNYNVNGKPVRVEAGEPADGLSDKAIKDLLAINAIRKQTAKERKAQ